MPPKDPRRPSMYQQAMAHCANLSGWQVFLFSLLLAMSVEAFTAWMRFGLGLESTRDTGLIGNLTFGIRIHHGYVGVVVILMAWAVFSAHAGPRHPLVLIGLPPPTSDL